ncbi:hypothetical protein Trydic_g21082 [Trypoxylus dichotomus]
MLIAENEKNLQDSIDIWNETLKKGRMITGEEQLNIHIEGISIPRVSLSRRIDRKYWPRLMKRFENLRSASRSLPRSRSMAMSFPRSTSISFSIEINVDVVLEVILCVKAIDWVILLVRANVKVGVGVKLNNNVILENIAAF